MPLILGTNSIKDTGYNVANSCRLQGTGDYFYRTNSSATNTYTFSVWIKKSDPLSDGNEWLFSSDESGLMIRDTDAGDSGDQFHFYNNSNTTNYFSGAKRRDIASWYNIILSSNSGTGTIYVNGVVDKSSIVIPNLSTASNGFVIGKHPSANSQFFGGYMAEVVFIEGSALDHTSFGEFDSDTGIWKPISVSGLTFGTNGFYLDFEDSSALGNDVSGNNNDLTFNGSAINQSIDTCTNNFATLNPLLGIGIGSYSEGNLKISGVSGNWSTAFSTIAVTQGKWYVEGKSLNTSMMAGVISTDQAHNVINDFQGKQSRGWGYESTGRLWNNASDTVGWGSTYTTNDIIGVALDLDNNRLFFSKNGVFQNSGDPTSSTGAISIPSGYEWFIAYSPVDSTSQQWELNFGSPSFAISSGNTDGNGYGNFEYAVPSSYYSLCTKNLAEYG